MGLFNWKKNSKKAKLTEEEVDQLKEQLDEKMGEFRTIYHDLVEAGGSELPEDILESVSGGLIAKAITTPDMYGTWCSDKSYRQFLSDQYQAQQNGTVDRT
ncbi:MAG: hypothetical protein J5545_11660 [Bacteroidaceae bacterium]|nr:hypothetical protein [Bacteroidaceae bacterium]